jgi:hypothetical protein
LDLRESCLAVVVAKTLQKASSMTHWTAVRKSNVFEMENNQGERLHLE